MRLHLKNIDSVVHGWIAQHKAKCGFKNLDDTVASLIQLATIDYPDRIAELERMNEALSDDLKAVMEEDE